MSKRGEEPDCARPVSFAKVHEDEIRVIARLRASREAAGLPGQAGTGMDAAAASPQQIRDREVETRGTLLGLAFSGGGIRSATFNLGVLQALAELDLLRKVDYLSTVSGGGYIGGWLQALIRRQVRARDTHFDASQLQHMLTPQGRFASSTCAQRVEQPEIRFLRDHSNYLAPKLGLFTADAWTLGVIYVRNLLLNLSVLLPALAALLLLSSATVHMHEHLASLTDRRQVYGEAGLCFLGSIASALYLLTRDSRGGTRRLVYALVVGPLLVGSWLISTFAFDPTWYVGTAPWIAGIALSYAALWGIAWTARSEQDVHPLEAAGAALGGILFGMALLYGLAHLLSWTYPTGRLSADLTPHVFSMSLVVIVIGLALGFQVGFFGPRLGEHLREWGSRLVALLWICSLVLGVLLAVAQFGPDIAHWIYEKCGVLAMGLWGGTTIGGLWAGRSGSVAPAWLTAVLRRVAPYVFAGGLLIVVSTVLQRHVLVQLPPAMQNTAAPLLGAAALLLFASWLLSERIGVNEFSIHALYRNRLVRCYLGAARGSERDADDFVGFDRKDDALRVDELSAEAQERCPLIRPYHIINASLNGVSGARLAWQLRRARSFVFTPLYAGFDARAERDAEPATSSVHATLPPRSGLWDEGYRPSAEYAGGISLGTAIAISGAAVAPNMGAYTSPALAFLMTVFNLRLGWWLGNPRHVHAWNKPGPKFGLVSLLFELLGNVSDRRRYVYLSDGGHFENLGIYELVRRKCRYIVASDASADPQFAFADLAGAIEKCRADFGVEIEVDLTSFGYDSETRRTIAPCVVGRIRYDPDDPTRDGTLVYLKACMTGCEPADVLGYARAHPLFPHEPTTDQWFDETQFESYRALGEHVAQKAFAALAHDSPRDVERAFVVLQRHWTARSPYNEEAFAKHSDALGRIYDAMRESPALAFLDEQIYPEWRALLAQTTDRAPTKEGERTWLPPNPDQLREGFYLCQKLIQVMENVYLDLRLEHTCEHPDNRGWMNLFRHWSWSSMFRITWVIVGPTTGARFQTFVERHFAIGQGESARPLGGDAEDTPPRPEIELRFSRPFDAGDLKSVDLTALDLSFLEHRLLERVVTTRALARGNGCSFEAFSAAIKVKDVNHSGTEGGGEVAFTMAFGVVRGKRLCYLRIRDHLRRSGFAREILCQLVEDPRGIATVEAVERSAYAELGGLITKEHVVRLRRLFESVRREQRRTVRKESAESVAIRDRAAE